MLKRIVAVVITSMALLATGAVSTAGTAAPVSEASRVCAYPDSVVTFVTVAFKRNPIRSGHKGKVYVIVRASGTGGAPTKGSIAITVAGKTIVKKIRGGGATYRTPRLFGYRNQSRSYLVRVTYRAPRCSVYKNSSKFKVLKVLPRRR
jgi:hypothetical protein